MKWRNPEGAVDKAKAENLILHICREMENCPEFGAIVLAKVLYYVDHAHYLKYGKKLTGFSYVKQKLGPTPKPSEFLPIRERLISSKRIEEKPKEYFGRIQKRLHAVGDPDLSAFTQEEVALIGSIINSLTGVSGKSASDLTHEELSWKLASQMEELPDYAYLLTEAQLGQTDLDWAKKVINGYRPQVC
jgi:hypothetical protein